LKREKSPNKENHKERKSEIKDLLSERKSHETKLKGVLKNSGEKKNVGTSKGRWVNDESIDDW
jgi:hypothetical protein